MTTLRLLLVDEDPGDPSNSSSGIMGKTTNLLQILQIVHSLNMYRLVGRGYVDPHYKYKSSMQNHVSP